MSLNPYKRALNITVFALNTICIFQYVAMIMAIIKKYKNPATLLKIFTHSVMARENSTLCDKNYEIVHNTDMLLTAIHISFNELIKLTSSSKTRIQIVYNNKSNKHTIFKIIIIIYLTRHLMFSEYI